MKKHPYKNKRRLHLIPLLLGIYAALLGLSLTAMGLAELREGIGIFRFLLGLGMAGFGLFGIWDGIRDLLKPEKTSEKPWFQQEKPTGMKSSGQTETAHPNESPVYGRQLLVIFKENWQEEHKFFSIRDVELTVEGIQKGTYQKAVLEWGTQAFDLFPGIQSDLLVVWCLYSIEQKDTRFFAREGTVTQVTFWLNQVLNDSSLKEAPALEEMAGWSDITSQVKKSR